MPRPWRIRYAGARYHVTSRGNGRQRVFFGDDDYTRFLGQLEDALERDEVVLYAYCLMPNHYHLFVETPLGNIQRFMQRLNTAYSMYFRYKHSRPGHCLQGRYGAKLVGGDDYIARVTRYVHLNPVETEAMKRKPLAERQRYLRVFPWSSYPGYIKKDEVQEWVDYRWLSLMGKKTESGCRRAYGAYTERMIGKKDELLDEALQESRYTIGDKEFIEETESDLREMKLQKVMHRDVSLPKGPEVALHDVDEAVALAFGVDAKHLHFHGHRAGKAKGIAIELCCELSGRTQREIAAHYGYKSDAGVTFQRRAIRQTLDGDEAFARRLTKIRKKLLKVKL